MRLIKVIIFFFTFWHCQAQIMKCEVGAVINPSDSFVLLDDTLNIDDLSSNRNEIIIPLVFHVVSNENQGIKIDNYLIYNLIDNINKAFAGINLSKHPVPKEFEGLIGNSSIRFCLGIRTVEGKKEIGITYDTTNIRYFGQQFVNNDNRRRKVKYSEEGGADSWGSDKYINIWIAELLNYNGYTTLPTEDYPDDEMGIIVAPSTIELKKNASVLIHEIGHYLGLYHIWGKKDNECAEDDGIEDTPLQEHPFEGCPEYPQYTCGTSNMFMNYMDNTDYTCSAMFTKDQMKRMLQTIEKYRPSLIESGSTYCEAKNINQQFTDIEAFSTGDFLYINTELPSSYDLFLVLFDISGKQVSTGEIKKNQYSCKIDTKDLPVGVYILLLKNASDFEAKKIFIY